MKTQQCCAMSCGGWKANNNTDMPLSDTLSAKRDQLIELLSGYGSCAVAFSGGVDSAVVAKAAKLALGDHAVLVTGKSAALAAGELETAREVAATIGVRHVEIATEEFDNPNYVANAPDRCYHCKSELYTQLDQLADRIGMKIVANGANADDLGDYRPGMQAAVEHSVLSPLAECGMTKQEVRELAAYWGLPVAEKPATPCLSSRVAYGQAVTPERLAMIDSAEQFLRSVGFRELRVRYHEGDMARIEVPVGEIAELCDPGLRATVVDELKKLGFKFVTLDLAGFKSGNLNRLISPEELRRFR
jgi:pyridinium-3,5-biscarboxylic acid mononucleotide sulfurtransferase